MEVPAVAALKNQIVVDDAGPARTNVALGPTKFDEVGEEEDRLGHDGVPSHPSKKQRLIRAVAERQEQHTGNVTSTAMCSLFALLREVPDAQRRDIWRLVRKGFLRVDMRHHGESDQWTPILDLIGKVRQRQGEATVERNDSSQRYTIRVLDGDRAVDVQLADDASWGDLFHALEPPCDRTTSAENCPTWPYVLVHRGVVYGPTSTLCSSLFHDDAYLACTLLAGYDGDTVMLRISPDEEMPEDCIGNRRSYHMQNLLAETRALIHDQNAEYAQSCAVDARKNAVKMASLAAEAAEERVVQLRDECPLALPPRCLRTKFLQRFQ